MQKGVLPRCVNSTIVFNSFKSYKKVKVLVYGLVPCFHTNLQLTTFVTLRTIAFHFEIALIHCSHLSSI